MLSRVTRACVALCTSAVVAGAVTSCAQLFDVPDGTLADGGDGSPGPSPGSEGGTDGRADDGGSTDRSDGSDGRSAGGADASPPSDGAPAGDTSAETGAAESGAGEGGATEAGADCAPAALSFYVQDDFNHVSTVDFAGKKLDRVFTADCIDRNDPQHLAITRAGHGWLLGEDGRIHDLSLTKGTCSGLGTVTGGQSFSYMSLAFARLGAASADALYTCSTDGLGTIDLQSFAWSAIQTPEALDYSRGCTVKQGRNGTLAVLASSLLVETQYTLYEVDVDAGSATATIRSSKAFGTTVYDDGEDEEPTFDLAWSSSASLYYLFTIDSGGNSSSISTYDPSSGDVESLFDSGANTLVMAAQSTCAR